MAFASALSAVCARRWSVGPAIRSLTGQTPQNTNGNGGNSILMRGFTRLAKKIMVSSVNGKEMSLHGRPGLRFHNARLLKREWHVDDEHGSRVDSKAGKYGFTLARHYAY